MINNIYNNAIISHDYYDSAFAALYLCYENLSDSYDNADKTCVNIADLCVDAAELRMLTNRFEKMAKKRVLMDSLAGEERFELP